MRFPFRRASAAAAAPPASASVDTANVRQYFDFEWAVHQDDHPDLDTYWWWTVSVRVDPNEVWMEAEDGTLWVIPFSTDGETEITVAGAPQQSRLVAVPVSAADGATASVVVNRRRQQVLATYHERPAKPGRDNPAAASAGPEPEGITMDESVRQVLVRQGIDPDQATEEQINAAKVLAGSEQPEPEGDPQPESEGDPQPEPEGDATPPPAAASTAPPAGTVVVDAERLAALEADMAARQRDERDRIIATAMTEGRFAPARRAHYEQAWDTDPDGTRHLLTASAADGGLAPNTIPVHLRGSSHGTSNSDPGLDRVRASMGLKPRKEA